MIRDFDVSDIYTLDVQAKQLNYKSHVQAMAESNQLGETYSYVENGKVQAIIGAQEYWKGRVAVWALIGNVGNWIRFHREAVALLNRYSKAHNVVRFELTTSANFDESERWAEMLGFKFESLMASFGVHGEDHKMWVILCQQQ